MPTKCEESWGRGTPQAWSSPRAWVGSARWPMGCPCWHTGKPGSSKARSMSEAICLENSKGGRGWKWLAWQEMGGRQGLFQAYRSILCLVSNARPLMIFKESNTVKEWGKAGRTDCVGCYGSGPGSRWHGSACRRWRSRERDKEFFGRQNP